MTIGFAENCANDVLLQTIGVPSGGELRFLSRAHCCCLGLGWLGLLLIGSSELNPYIFIKTKRQDRVLILPFFFWVQQSHESIFVKSVKSVARAFKQ